MGVPAVKIFERTDDGADVRHARPDHDARLLASGVEVRVEFPQQPAAFVPAAPPARGAVDDRRLPVSRQDDATHDDLRRGVDVEARRASRVTPADVPPPTEIRHDRHPSSAIDDAREPLAVDFLPDGAIVPRPLKLDAEAVRNHADVFPWHARRAASSTPASASRDWFPVSCG
jgi:hypothetical protein